MQKYYVRNYTNWCAIVYHIPVKTERRDILPERRRQKSSTGVYHVIVKGIARENNFGQTREKLYFKKVIKKYLKKYEVKIYSYCIMSNHAHLMIQADLEVLSLFMARILAEYAFYYNYKHNRNGHVFQNRFKSECIETEAYFWNCLRYIHMNPVKAGMAARVSGYRFSSMPEFFSDKETIIDPEIIISVREKFGDKTCFEKFHGDRKYEVFQDTYDEMEQQRLEIAEKIAKEMYETARLDYQTQIFEEKAYREAYINQLQQMLNVSQRKSKILYSKIRNQVKNN